MSSITISPQAYSLLLLHSAKHPQSTVTGFLLGTTSSDGKAVVVEKVVTLGHHWTNLAAIEDVALGLLEAHLTTSGFSLLGIYEAPARSSADKLSFSAIRLASKVAQRTQKKSKTGITSAIGGSLALLINVSQLILTPPAHALTPFVVSPSNSTSAQSLTSSTATLTLQDEQSTIADTLKSIRETAVWKDVRDFDDHLEDVSVDWLDNSTATKAIQASS